MTAVRSPSSMATQTHTPLCPILQPAPPLEPTSTDAEYKTVRGFTRGLEVLQALNRLPAGGSPTKLAQLTGLHRATIRRSLETLLDSGYVRRSPSDDSFHLTRKVRELSDGFSEEDWISECAAPLLGELLHEVLWPSDLLTFDVDAMVVRESTHRFSRLSFHRAMVGRRMPLLQTAAGIAYLAFCPEDERTRILEILSNRTDDPSCTLARQPRELAQRLGWTRERGYGENYQSWSEDAKVAAVAVPIHHANGQLLGCLNVIYLAKAMPMAQAVQRYLPALQHTARRIQQATGMADLKQPHNSATDFYHL